MDRLKNKRALITGGTSGIGLETARQFLNEGARVAITGKNPATLEAARQELGTDVLIIPADASDGAAQKMVAETIRQQFGSLDILFVNAGLAELHPLEQWSEAAFDHTFAINVKGPFFLVQALLPILANPASIILNASVNAHIGMPNTSVYGASKAALLSLARTLSGELISRGIRVNAISPGPIATPLYSKLGLSESDLKNVSSSIQSQVPAGRFGNPGEIAMYDALNNSPGRVGPPLEPPPADIRQYWHTWLEQDGFPYWSFWENVRTWWEIRNLPNILLVHFDVLKRHMPEEMRRIAAFLDITINETKWDEIVEHCTFEWMREHGEKIVPMGGAMWKGGTKTFINKGTNGRWKETLTEAESAEYEGKALAELGPECALWLATGERF